MTSLKKSVGIFSKLFSLYSVKRLFKYAKLKSLALKLVLDNSFSNAFVIVVFPELFLPTIKVVAKAIFISCCKLSFESTNSIIFSVVPNFLKFVIFKLFKYIIHFPLQYHYKATPKP